MHRYTDEQKEWIRQNYRGKSNKELTDVFNYVFHTCVTVKMIKSYKGNHGLSSGLTGRFTKGHVPANKGKKGVCAKGSEKTWFSPGVLPPNTDPVGTEKLLADGYIWVKVNNVPKAPKKVNWKQKHVLLWEDMYGPVPDGHCLLFLDGDRTHIELSNLELISRKTLAVLNKRGLIRKNSDLTRSGIQIAKLIQAIGQCNKSETTKRRELK